MANSSLFRLLLSQINEDDNVINDVNPLTITLDSIDSSGAQLDVSLVKTGSPIVSGLHYRFDQSDDWTPYEIGTILQIGGANSSQEHRYVQFRNMSKYLSTSKSDYVKFEFSDSSNDIVAQGNIQSLLNYSNKCTPYCYYKLFCDTDIAWANIDFSSQVELAQYCCAYMFADSKLYNIPCLNSVKLAPYCYSHMFQNCGWLGDIGGVLPAKILPSHCYQYMFADSTILSIPYNFMDNSQEVGEYACFNMFNLCMYLTTVMNSLPAMKLSSHCYDGMFSHTRCLSTVPSLPATEMAPYCYKGMFQCSALPYTPNLPATTLAQYCYNSMFMFCTSLCDDACNLPAPVLTEGCYSSMFTGCQYLSSIGVISATTLAKDCYSSMFAACFQLTQGPELFAEELVDGCYKYMFDQCYNLNSIKVHFTDWKESLGATDNWLQGVAGNGTFTKPQNLQELRDWGTYIPENWTVENIPVPSLTFTPTTANATIKLNSGSYSFTLTTIQYRIFDGSTLGSWTTYTLGTTLTLSSTSNYIQFKNTSTSLSTGTSKYVYFSMTGTWKASGNIQSMLNYSESCKDYCYYYLFNGCSNLTTAPELPATTLAPHCYQNMFYGCSKLTTAPELPATTLVNDCYFQMFYGCTSLTTAPELPATTLVNYCYSGMFRNCSKLTTAPELPAIVLADNCYQYMFYGCTSLTTAPELPATTLADWCYYNMFYNCSNLNYIKVSFDTWSTSFATTQWLYNVAATGTFIKNAELPETIGASYIPENWTIKIHDILTFTAVQANSTIKINKNGSGTFSTIYYRKSTDLTWQEYSYGTDIILQNIDDYVEFKSNSSVLSSSSSKYVSFEMTGKIAASGNVQSLLNFNQYVTAYAFYKLFYNCTSLTTAPELPATTLNRYCYRSMFEGCTSLTTAPALPATALDNDCYRSMFEGCTSLTTAPALPAMKVIYQCYYNMFKGCTSLTAAPELPATTFQNINSETYTGYDGSSCYYGMFQNCTNLITPPTILPITQLCIVDNSTGITYGMHYCYAYMFKGCISLTATPQLPATILANNCYEGMFEDCTLLTTTPQLPATNLSVIASEYSGNYCYRYMFKGCTSLINAPELPATIISESCYYGMFQNCTSLKNPPALPILDLAGATATGDNFQNYCYAYMFAGCTSLQYGPELPATRTIAYGYHRMFAGCTSLKEIPALDHITSVDQYAFDHMFENCTALTTVNKLPLHGGGPGAYDYMFSGCKNIKVVHVPWTDWNSENYMTNCWLAGVAAEGTFYKDDELQQIWGESYIPGGWTVIDSQPLTFIAKQANSTVTLKSYGSPNISGIYYKTNSDSQWKVYTTQSIITLSAVNKWVKFKNINSTLSLSKNDYVQFEMSGKIEVTGTIQSMINYSAYCPMYCFYKLFKDCTALTSAPSLPCKIIGNFCYANMFEGCTQLEIGPELPAKNLAESCYAEMFKNCTNLKYLSVKFQNWIENATYNWVENITGSGIFTKDSDLPATYGNSYIPTSWKVDENTPFSVTYNAYNDYAYNQPIYVSLNGYSGITCTTLLYRTDEDRTWRKYTLGTSIELLGYVLDDMGNRVQKTQSAFVQFMNLSQTFSVSVTKYIQLHVSPFIQDQTNQIFIEGNIQSLLNYSTACTPYCFYNLFSSMNNGYYDFNGLDLKATVLAEYCYAHMFSNCSNIYYMHNLSHVISLAAGCCEYMYRNCPTLGASDGSAGIEYSLPGKDIPLAANCYEGMFADCSSLTNYSDNITLPATILANSCYMNMFKGCTSLQYLPYLPAKDLKEYCYCQMFCDCTNLYYDYSGLTINTVEPYCCCGMFLRSGLYDISFFKFNATTLAESCYDSMFADCSSLSIGYENGLTLPATTLAPYCYRSMFAGCSIYLDYPQTIIELPASTLAFGCYDSMFYGCSYSNYFNIRVGFTDWHESIYATQNWLYGLSDHGGLTENLNFYKPAALTEIYDTSHIPAGWTVHNEY